MTVEELRSNWKPSIVQLAEKRGAKQIWVFGSVARNQSNEQSDIDFLVELQPGRTLFDLSGLLVDLEALLKMPVDVVTPKGLRPKIRERVWAEAVLL